ncbi:hypothetical protein MBLNU459_g0213t1 [Dothideomycetes sp. NU459]
MPSSKDVAWYAKDIAAALPDETRDMLERYSNIPPSEVEQAIQTTLDRSWAVAPWPSVGSLTWLNRFIELHPSYQAMLSAVKRGAIIVDCGCFIGQDLRWLAYQGAPTDNMYGVDIEPAWFPIAYDFYRDRDSFKGHFLHADILAAATVAHDDAGSPFAPLCGAVDILWAAKFLHLFSRTGQINAVERLMPLLKRPGGIIVGSQNGLPEAADIPVVTELSAALPGAAIAAAAAAAAAAKGDEQQQKTIWLADPAAFRAMWDEVAARTGTKWHVDVGLLDLRTIGLHKDDGSLYKKRTGYTLQFTCTLL